MGQPNNPNIIIKELASLTVFEYEKRRLIEASNLSLRVTMLDGIVKKEQEKNQNTSNHGGILFAEIESWHESVNGASLLTELSVTIRKFVILSEHDANAVALWILFTHTIDAANVAPILNICSPEKRCGKTTLLSLLENLVKRPLLASNITPAAIFRTIEEYKPTLLLDESDTFVNNEKSELRGIINSGHTRSSAYVIRTVGEDHTPQKFSTWGAKCLAGIGNLPDTIKDRSISITLRRKLSHETVDSLRYTSKEQINRLHRQCVRFALDNIAFIQEFQPILAKELNDRAADNWEPLIAIAEIAGGEWPKLAKNASIQLSASEELVTLSVELLQDIKNIFEEKLVDRISTADLLIALCMDVESPWATYNRGQPMSARQLAKRLKEFKINSGTIRLVSGHTPKGYYSKSFDDSFKRYVPCNDATTPQDSKDALYDDAKTSQ
jgi:putative DNA primase/helicase